MTYVKSCVTNSVTNHIQIPTRVTHNRSTVLDIILPNVVNTSNSGVINYNISDHLPVFMVKKRQKIQHEKTYLIGRTYRNYDKIVFQSTLKKA